MAITQAQLADKFDATQGSASRWQRVPRPQRPGDGRVAALREFCAEALDRREEAVSNEPATPIGPHDQPPTSREATRKSDDEAFADTIWLTTGERALADRQAELVDATIRHLAACADGYTEADGAAHQWCAQVLGLGHS